VPDTANMRQLLDELIILVTEMSLIAPDRVALLGGSKGFFAGDVWELEKGAPQNMSDTLVKLSELEDAMNLDMGGRE
jgi:hypothetical protein